jgi:outer membrane receptor protein involved in Fe transport
MNRIAGGNNLDIGAFAEASFKPSEALTLTVSGRIDRWWISDGTRRTRPLAGGATTVLDFPDRKGWRPTGRAGIAWKPAQAVTLRAAGYLGWRLPTLNELYRPFRVGSDSTVANAALKPERLKGVELGVDYRPISTLRFSATLFANKLQDAIANVTIDPVTQSALRNSLCPGLPGSGACRQRQNIDAIRSRGVEIEADARLGDFDLNLSYALTDAKVHASGVITPLDGLRPAQTPRHQLNGTIAWRPAKGPSAFVALHYVSSQYDDDQNTPSTRLRGAVTLDAGASVPIWDRFSVVARVENLTNKLVDVGYSNGTVLERAAPRTFWVGLRWGS